MTDYDDTKGIKCIPFDGKQWLLWKTKWTSWADGLGYTEFLSPPADGVTLTADQVQKQKKCKSSLVISLDNHVLGNFCEEAKIGNDVHVLWKAMVAFYERTNNDFKHNLRRALYNQRLADDEDMSSYTQRIRNLALELQNIGDKPSDTDIVYALLEGLGPMYNVIATKVRMDGKASADLIPILIDQQAVIRRQQAESHPKSIHVVSTNKRKFESIKGSTSNQSSQRPRCTKCKKSGHVESKCWFAHPHLRPNWLREKLATTSPNQQNQKPNQTSAGPEFNQATALLTLVNDPTSHSHDESSQSNNVSPF